MPSLSLSTDKETLAGSRAATSTSTARARSRSKSPPRPPMSPITPPLAATRLPGDRQTYTHTTQPEQQTAMKPPPPDPIDLEDNPDAIALKSAISILQMQRQRAAADMKSLSKAKDEAVQDPEAYVQHLVGGASSGGGGRGGEGKGEAEKREWTPLPKPQDVVRCPPINWSQYAVVGESLDKLHAEQVSRPTQGTPAVVGQNGVFEFKGGDGTQERYPGPAAPYNPAKDKIDRKPKAKK